MTYKKFSGQTGTTTLATTILAFRRRHPAGGGFHRGRLPEVLPVPGTAAVGAGLRHGPAGGRVGRPRLRLTGFDLCRSALDYLRRRLTRRGLSATGRPGRYDAFPLASPFDAAFCPVNSFRHLFTEEAARSHLSASPPPCGPAGSTSWACIWCRPTPRKMTANGGPPATAARKSPSPCACGDRPPPADRAPPHSLLARTGVNRSTAAPGCGRQPAWKEIRLRDEFSFRLYTAPQIRRFLAGVPGSSSATSTISGTRSTSRCR